MKNQKTGKKSKKKIILIIVLLIVVAVIGYGVYAVKNVQNTIANMSNTVTTDTVSTRTLTKSVGATGTIVAMEKRDVTLTLSGTVEELNVEVGDTVAEGDQLLVLDTDTIESNLSDVQKQYNATVQSNELSTEGQEISTDDSVRRAQTTADNAYDSWQDAIKAYNDAKGDYSNACYYYDNASADMTSYYKGRVDYFKELYENAEKAMDKAEKAYNEALADLESTKKSVENQKASTAVSQSTSTLSYSSQIRSYKDQIADGTAVAPISGLVTNVNCKVGDSYAAGTTAVTIQDVTSYEIETEIGEYDISDIALGQTVLIKTDATGEEQMTGKVTEISPVATTTMTAAGTTTTGSSVTYKVRISIDNPSERLRLDMTASLSIIISEHDNALTVPYNAVSQDADGSYYVTVIDDVNADGSANTASDAATEDGAEVGRRVNVEVVMESNYYTEIRSSELKDGDTVLVNMSSALDVMQELMDEGGF